MKETEPWTYELALLYQAGTLPAVKDVELELEYHVETPERPNSGNGDFLEQLAGSELDKYLELWQKDVYILGPAP